MKLIDSSPYCPRRLPIYLVIDSSEDISNEFSKFVDDGIQELLHIWNSDPFMLESVMVSIVLYSDQGALINPFVETYEVKSPFLPNPDITNGLEVLDVLMEHMDNNLRKTTTKQRGDFKPFVIVFSSDAISNSTHGNFDKWGKHYSIICNLVVFDIGNKSNACYDFEIEQKLKLSLNILSNNVIHVYPSQTDFFMTAIRFLGKSIITYAFGNSGINNYQEFNLETGLYKIKFKFDLYKNA